MTLTFNTHISSHIQLDVYSYLLSGQWPRWVLKNPLFSHFPIEKPKLPFDIAVKTVMVTPGPSFEQTMLARSPRCYIPTFVEIGLPVLQKKIFQK